MPLTKSTTGKRGLQPEKVQKPRPDFPLTPHRGSGQWCFKRKGKIYYCGKLEDPEAAERFYKEKVRSLESGTTMRPVEVVTGRVTVDYACQFFLHGKKAKLDRAEISQRTWKEHCDTCKVILKTFTRERLVSDLRAEDFMQLRNKLAKRFGPVRLGNEVYRVRSVFKYALESAIIVRPVEFGPDFKRPAKRLVRLARAAKGPRMLEPEECQAMLKRARPALKTFILLGLNGGFTARDCGTLPRKAVDLQSGFINYARPKTGVARRVPLWPETIAAMKQTMAQAGDLAFLTTAGTPFAKDERGNDPIGLACRRLLTTLKLHRDGLGFATFRHIFQTIGEGSKDFPAVKAIQGHVDDSISDNYREGVADDRLRAVTDTVRNWLFTTPTKD